MTPEEIVKNRGALAVLWELLDPYGGRLDQRQIEIAEAAWETLGRGEVRVVFDGCENGERVAFHAMQGDDGAPLKPLWRRRPDSFYELVIR